MAGQQNNQSPDSLLHADIPVSPADYLLHYICSEQQNTSCCHFCSLLYFICQRFHRDSLYYQEEQDSSDSDRRQTVKQNKTIMNKTATIHYPKTSDRSK